MVLAFFEKRLDGCLRSRVVEQDVLHHVAQWHRTVRWVGVRVRLSLAHQESGQGPGRSGLLDPGAAPVQRSYMGARPH